MTRGRSLAEAMGDSVADLDGAYNYLVASSEGLGVVRDRFGFKPLMLVETGAFVVVSTEEIALRKALPGDYRMVEPPPGAVHFWPIASGRVAGAPPPEAIAEHAIEDGEKISSLPHSPV